VPNFITIGQTVAEIWRLNKKPEVHKVRHCRQRSTDPRQLVTRRPIQKMYFEHCDSGDSLCKLQTYRDIYRYRQADRNTYKLFQDDRQTERQTGEHIRRICDAAHKPMHYMRCAVKESPPELATLNSINGQSTRTNEFS